jgi:hypothetical protein
MLMKSGLAVVRLGAVPGEPKEPSRRKQLLRLALVSQTLVSLSQAKQFFLLGSKVP